MVHVIATPGFVKFDPQSARSAVEEGIVGPFVAGRVSFKILPAGMSPDGVTLNV